MSIQWFFKTVFYVNMNDASEKIFQTGIFFLINIFLESYEKLEVINEPAPTLKSLIPK